MLFVDENHIYNLIRCPCVNSEDGIADGRVLAYKSGGSLQSVGGGSGFSKTTKIQILKFQILMINFWNILRNYANVMVNMDLENASIFSDIE